MKMSIGLPSLINFSQNSLMLWSREKSIKWTVTLDSKNEFCNISSDISGLDDAITSSACLLDNSFTSSSPIVDDGPKNNTRRFFKLFELLYFLPIQYQLKWRNKVIKKIVRKKIIEFTGMQNT